MSSWNGLLICIVRISHLLVALISALVAAFVVR